MNKFKAIIRLFYLANLVFINGLNYVLFLNSQVYGCNILIEELDKDTETCSFIENLDNNFDKAIGDHEEEN